MILLILFLLLVTNPPSLQFDSKKFSNIITNPFLLFQFPGSNLDSDADSDIDYIFTPEKVGVMNTTLAISISTSV